MGRKSRGRKAANATAQTMAVTAYGRNAKRGQPGTKARPAQDIGVSGLSDMPQVNGKSQGAIFRSNRSKPARPKGQRAGDTLTPAQAKRRDSFRKSVTL